VNAQQETTTADWWGNQPIPLDPVNLDTAAMTVRGASQPIARRSEYAELAELAAGAGPRDTRKLLEEARRVGSLLGLRAFYDFPAGDGRVTGPTIDLMDALAIVWGRLVQRVEVLDETPTRVHLRGRIVDLLALTATERDYVSAIAPAPGKFANKPDQAERWRVMQIQSASSKAVRGALEHALPAWLVDVAMDSARTSANNAVTGGRPLAEVRRVALEILGKHGLDRATLEAWVEQVVDLWTVDELAKLLELRRRLDAGQVVPETIRAEAQINAAASAGKPPATGDRLGSLGLGKPPAAPPPAAPPPSSPPSPSSAPQGTGTATPASGGDPPPPPLPKPDLKTPVVAAALRERVRQRLEKGETAWPEEVKTAFKGAAGVSRATLGALKTVLDHGAEAGWWTITTQRTEAGELTGYGLAPVPTEPPKPAEPEAPKGPTPPPWDKLVGSALEQVVDAIGQRLGSRGEELTDEVLGGIGERAPTDEELRKLGRRLWDEERALAAEAGGR
jgi:hypothetical protein